MYTDLTERVMAYQKLIASDTSNEAGKHHYAYLCDACRLIFYTYPVKVRILGEEEAVELMLSLEGRLKTLIETFRYERLSFEGYVRRVAYLQAQLFVRRRGREERKHRSLFHTIDDIDEENVADRTAIYGNRKTDPAPWPDENQWSEDSDISKLLKKQLKKSETTRKRFLQLVLLCADELSADQVSFLARFIGMEERKLASMLAKTHEMSDPRRKRTEKLISIRNGHYHVRQFLKRELHMLQEYHADPILIERTKMRLVREDHQFMRSIAELRHRPNPVTHLIVAQQTGVPKGTVDSGLHTIRQFIGKMMDGAG